MSAAFSIDGCVLQAPSLEPGLYLTATPIGNLGDMTVRALRTLAAADRVLCEDTRVTRRLLDHYGINRRTTAYHEHNAAEMGARIADWIASGDSVALVSDAGSPLISDPGDRLVAALVEAGHPVTVVPGPSAVVAGLSLSAFPSDAFLFAGFLPAKAAARRKRIAAFAGVDALLVFYESPHRVVESLRDMATVLGDRHAAVTRELTKRFEEVARGSLSAVIADFAGREAIKGEFCIVVDRPAADMAPAFDLDAALGTALQTSSLRDAVARVMAESGLPRKTVYARALVIKADGGP
ncbi:MAG: 16S rRNA (cytidine(1402)-2'-O)-methyltransferase [Pseudomonadota bacterium]